MDKKPNKIKHKPEKNDKKTKLEKTIEEIETLKQRIINEVPPTGKFCKLTYSQSENQNENLEKWEQPISKFKDLPLSQKTINGLTESKFFKLTPIQRATLPHSLAQRDVMAASKTGSGKTLCFLIPLLELLYRERWSKEEGLGALVLLPTRELAIQVFDVLNKIGRYHNFSVGMVIGGNNLQKEQGAINYMNILIGTPGRILQHVTETPMFSADNLKLLVIDEADRILDEGFEENITEILSYLPTNRQTLLFSATLTRNLKRLGKVKLRSPEYINISNTDNVIKSEMDLEEMNKNELSIMKSQPSDINALQENDNSGLIPKNLNQFYTIVEAHEKVNVLYSFLKTHKTSKCLVFVTSCKQVRFFSEIFKRLKLGMTILDIHGRQSQGKRSSTFFTFSQKRNSVVLFATDVASRGVDFPAIDWVIQLDAPEDISAYIHRVGRTARYKSEGSAVLFVSNKEEAFVNELKEKKIEIRKMKFAQNKITNLQAVVRSILLEHPDMVPMAEKAVSSYVKSINLFQNKNVFDIESLDLNKLALSYGLVSSPQLIKKKREEATKKDDTTIKQNKMEIDESEEEEEKEKEAIEINEEKKEKISKVDEKTTTKKKSKLEKLKEKIKQKKLLKQQLSQAKNEKTEEDDDFLFEKKSETINKKDKMLSKKIKREEISEKEEKSFENESESEEVSEKDKDEEESESESNEESAINSKKKKHKDKKEKEEKVNPYYEKVKKKLLKNKEADKIKEKARVFDKHKQDRLDKKQKDYEKHGFINNEEEDNEESSKSEDEINYSVEEEPKEKIKINVEKSSLKEKENAALELLKKKNKLFG